MFLLVKLISQLVIVRLIWGARRYKERNLLQRQKKRHYKALKTLFLPKLRKM